MVSLALLALALFVQTMLARLVFGAGFAGASNQPAKSYAPISGHALCIERITATNSCSINAN